MQRHVIFDEGREVSEVVVGRDLTHELSARLGAHRRIALLCQPATERLVEGYASYLESTGALVTTCSLPDGEAAIMVSDTAATGLSLLSFLGAGYHHRADRYQEHVKNALDFLVQHQLRRFQWW